ncbi:MAG: potassium-transporting ATPase subunit KdpC [Candidatus Protistobacter heckmanni]|nr:potassium-transporting ATPase subunit KdpC [Candidatus Protistobacter heckmanni]
MKSLRASLAMLAFTILLTGLAYLGLVAGVAALAFPDQAGGSLVLREGKVVGSRLIGQNFTEPKYFWGRLSASGSFPYNGMASGGSNLGPLNPALTDAAKARIDALRQADPGNAAPPPVDLVTASASGLDPEISLAAAQYQAGRVAAARGVDRAVVEQLIARHASGKWLGVFGVERVNVLALNLDLDTLAAPPAPRRPGA